jgi:hypothetical protein
MTFRQHLGKALIVSILTLLVIAAILALASAVLSIAKLPADSVNVPELLFFSGVVFVYTIMIGGAVIVAFGAPAYAALAARGRESWATAAAIGVTPGLAMLFIAKDLGFSAIACGLVIALVTHGVRRSRPNNSFKPKPLRGSA